LTPTEKEKLDMQARAQQMKINTRLTALQAGQHLMSLTTYSGEVGHLTLIAMATDIEKYILGEIEQETKDALEQLNKPKPTIVPAKDMPSINHR
jgi:hypothetical protein